MTQICVGKFAREIVILFDEQYPHIALVPEKRYRPTDILDDRGLNALGRLIEQQQLRARHQRARDRQLLLLAARQIATAPSQHRGEHGKQLEDFGR